MVPVSIDKVQSQRLPYSGNLFQNVYSTIPFCIPTWFKPETAKKFLGLS